ncbi:MAG TPA: hypothetical protein VMH81_34365 [Bryobacteraceae bacterium]|nr:hypothetical protein [Bryobacteraceae bacterium]
MIESDQLQHRLARIADLVQHLESAPDAHLRAQAKELMETVMALHGEALERMLESIRGSGESGQKILEGLTADPVVSSVLLLYGLHPEEFETRVRRVVENVRPKLRLYGADAELLQASAGIVRIRVLRVDSAFTARAIKAAIEDELYALAPDAASLVIEGLEKYASPDFVPLEKLGVLAAGKAGD